MNVQINFLLNKSLEFLRNSNLDSAELTLKQALRVQPKNPHALRLLGVISAHRTQYHEAIKFFKESLNILPKNALTLSNLGNVYFELGEYDNAIEVYDKSIKIDPIYEEAWSNKGNVLYKLKRHEEAIIHYDRAITLKPDYAEAWSNKGSALFELKLYEDAIIHYDRAISLKPDYAEAWSNKWTTLYKLKRYSEAILHYQKLLELRPNYAEAWSDIGNAFLELKHYEEAIFYYDRAISLKPDFAEAWSNKGNIFHEYKRYEEAIAYYDKAISLNPEYEIPWRNKANTLNFLKRHAESAKCYQKALELSDKHSYLLGQVHHQLMLTCDWTKYKEHESEIFCLVDGGYKGSEPFGFQAIAKSEDLLKKCAITYSNDKFPWIENSISSEKYIHSKIRIGYVCGEFREQATSILMNRVWELHDRSKFEIFAFDNGWNDGSEYRIKIECAFGNNIFDISKISDFEVVKLIRNSEIDILVNLNGFFGFARQGVFSYKPCPIQVNYLGFPGTMGAKYIDYMIVDKVVVPNDSRQHYVEKLVYLPDCYQANDDQRKISNRHFSKNELGLPENGFVFCCLNNNYKITPSIFDSWTRILKSVEGSVLWLLADNSTVKDNLSKEASARNIDPSRLVFADRMPLPEHLARHRQADLFLDTFPYNAHTTASDALWAGLPVLTLIGHTFPSRVAASLLNAIGLSELITRTPEEYEALAIELALNPSKLRDIKLKLANGRLTAPLFDSPRFTKNLEAAYIQMYERYHADLEPDHIVIT